ncbi:hypothetical protein OE88DRAFT_1810293 [Heliocybe sulcata]|uniref:Nephrocystin 3-like N-terminal domain-containing protein n=1 Tax=Heliocybe sulcata TaxID=5364 RepID=A0A5C3MUC8_9AGAM|nr:hypothetical protein OE88DRAFT_1810293 [Heliocybe sulcata]
MNGESDSVFLLVTNIRVEGLPPVDAGERLTKVFMRIRSGTVVQQTKLVSVHGSSHTWPTPIILSDIDARTPVSLTLHYTRWRGSQIVGSIERVFQFFHDHNGQELDLGLKCASRDVGPTIRIVCCTRHETVNDALLPSFHPGNDVANSRLTHVNDVVTALHGPAENVAENGSSISSVLESIEPFKAFFDEVAKIHPFAAAAWSLLSIAWNVLQAERTRTKKALDLWNSMVAAYELAREDDMLQKLNEFQTIFGDLMKQTSECALFLSQYFSGGFFRRLTNLAADKKMEAFQTAFVEFQGAFRSKAVRKITVVSLAAYEGIKFLERQTLLQRLQPHPQDGSADSRCLGGTRTEYINDILQWFSRDDNSVLWLTGPLGSGKTTLAFSIADHVSNIGPRGRLGAFILFRRDGALGMRDARRFVTTLAYKLAEFDDRIGDGVAKAVGNIPDLQILSPHQQFQRLVVEPLMSVNGLKDGGPLMVLVDALDECTQGQARELLLKDVISKGFGPSLSFIRFILTSRPTPDISEVLLSPRNNGIIRPLWIDVNTEQAARDIRLYFQTKIAEISGRLRSTELSEDDILQQLTARAGGLFIWASLTYEFIRVRPDEHIKLVLGDATHTVPDTDERLRRMYETTLEYLVGDISRTSIKNEIRDFVGTVVVAQTPPGMTPEVIGRLLANGRLASDTFDRLKTLVTSSVSQPVRFLHKSFYEYLEYETISGAAGWYISAEDYHKTIATHCLSRIQEYVDAHMKDPRDIESLRLAEHPQVPYASQYWMYHVEQMSTPDESMAERIGQFFSKFYLKWIHVILVLRQSDPGYDAIGQLGVLIDWVMRNPGGLDTALVQHALQFLRHILSRHTVLDNPVAVYADGLESAPPTNRIRQIYLTSEPKERLSAPVPLCHHTSWVLSVTFSPDGQYIASASFDLTVQVWDSTTGVLRYSHLSHRGCVYAVAFSATGDRIVSGDSQGHVFVWDAVTGEKLFDIPAHEQAVNTVAISPDGKSIASGYVDGTIILWDARTGKATVGPLHGHTDQVRSVAFSPDGTLLASGSEDETIRIWDTSTGEPVGEPLRGHTFSVTSVSFSPDGTCLASGDDTIRIWSVATGEAIGSPLRGHHDTVTSVAFSPEGTRLASASADQTIRIWDVATRSTILGPLTGHTNWIYSVAWSPDGRRIVSGSWDCTVRVWDALTGGVLFSSKGQT